MSNKTESSSINYFIYSTAVYIIYLWQLLSLLIPSSSNSENATKEDIRKIFASLCSSCKCFEK